MNLRSFLKLVEIQTKVASVIPYLLGTVFALYKFEEFHLKEAVLLFMGMLIFDMTTTAINNYVDYSKAIKKEGFGYEEHNAITKYNLNPKHVLGTIIGMLVLSSILGIILVLNTDVMVLIIGVICFGVGIVYSFGPIPISRTPFGEIFSGLTMGCLITFLAVYVHIYDQGIIALQLTQESMAVTLNIKEIIEIVLISLPAVTGIANIMLANNICDIEDDVINKRYTLPIYIGKPMALQVFRALYYIGFMAVGISVLLGILPVVSLLMMVTLKPVLQHIKIFMGLQSKAETFVLAVKNFVLMNGIYILTIIIGIVITKLK